MGKPNGTPSCNEDDLYLAFCEIGSHMSIANSTIFRKSMVDFSIVDLAKAMDKNDKEIARGLSVFYQSLVEGRDIRIIESFTPLKEQHLSCGEFNKSFFFESYRGFKILVDSSFLSILNFAPDIISEFNSTSTLYQMNYPFTGPRLWKDISHELNIPIYPTVEMILGKIKSVIEGNLFNHSFYSVFVVGIFSYLGDTFVSTLSFNEDSIFMHALSKDAIAAANYIFS